ncbi:MAG: subclass B3 metallo-beta-lactamase [Sphingomicrobium sp.]
MFASFMLAAAALAQPIVIPLGKNPPKVERPIAPIETAGPLFASQCTENDDWDKPAPPVRIHGNTYLVGTCGISSILITDKAGHILIDGGTEKGAELIAANISKLGFKLKDVKYLLHSHEHIDHVGGIARLQQLTGATLVASAEAAKVFETGTAGAGDPQIGLHPPFPAASVGRVITDGQDVRLGGLALTAIATPGHTTGALSWHWGSCDGGDCRRIVFADSLNPISRDNYKFSDRPAYVAAFRASIAKVAAVDCEILLTPHPSASNMIKRMAGIDPLVNTNACRDYAASKTKALDERLAKEAVK